MTDIAKRNRANKRAGAQWQTDIITYVRSKGDSAEGLRLAGREDEGDVGIRPQGFPDDHVVVEAKNEQRFDLAGYVKQAELEAANYAKRRGLPIEDVSWVVFLKRRNYPVGKAYAITSVDHYLAYDLDRS